jgi:hypothetical protein
LEVGGRYEGERMVSFEAPARRPQRREVRYWQEWIQRILWELEEGKGGGWRAEGGGWRVEGKGGGWRAAGGGWRVEGGGVEGGGVEGGGWRVEGGGWRAEGGGWRVEERGGRERNNLHSGE